MALNFGRFVHTEIGKYIMSILLGFGLASLFRSGCKDKNSLIFHAPPLDQFQDKIFKSNGMCLKYNHFATKCSENAKIITFE
jgi:hypothetical protein